MTARNVGTVELPTGLRSKRHPESGLTSSDQGFCPPPLAPDRPITLEPSNKFHHPTTLHHHAEEATRDRPITHPRPTHPAAQAAPPGRSHRSDGRPPPTQAPDHLPQVGIGASWPAPEAQVPTGHLGHLNKLCGRAPRETHASDRPAPDGVNRVPIEARKVGRGSAAPSRPVGGVWLRSVTDRHGTWGGEPTRPGRPASWSASKGSGDSATHFENVRSRPEP